MMKAKRVLATVLILGLLTGLLAGATLAQGTERPTGITAGSPITYQGRLSDGGSPASGIYDFEFKLYSGSSGDNQVGSTVTVDDQTVTDGLFTVELDFGMTVFAGGSRWLEIGVRAGSSSGAYTPLSPRQPLTPAPYAYYAFAASWYGLDDVPAGFDDGVDDNTTYTAGAGLTLGGGAFSVDFAGTGSAATVARSDHDHWGQSWSGSGVGLTLASSDDDGLAVTGGSGADDDGVVVDSAGGDGLHVGTVGGFGLHVDWAANGVVVTTAAGHGLRVDTAGGDGLHIGEAGSPSATNISLANDGIEVEGAEGNGLFVGRADADGVHVYSAGDDGIHATGGSDSDDFGGWFQGYSGVYGKGAGSNGYGGHFESNNRDGVYIASAGRDGVSVADASDYGLYVAAAGLAGVQVGGTGGIGVYANTTATNHEWGFYTPDKIYAGTTLASGGPLMFAAQNGDSRDLETGDVVAVGGLAAPLAEGESPLPLVQRAGPNDSAVIGVVYGRFVETKTVRGEERETWRTQSAPGPVAPGETLLIVVLGPAQVKVSAPAGGIRPGDRLTAAGEGWAARAETLQVDGVSFYPPGLGIGQAMEPLDKAGEGLIWAWVTLR